MRMRHLVAGIILGMGAYSAEPSKAPSDPRILSVYPPIVQSGVAAQVVVRGTSLSGSRALVFAKEGFQAQVLEVKNEPVKDGPVVGSVVVKLTAGVSQGSYPFRIVAAQGVSNELTLRVGTEAVMDEAGLGAPVQGFPLVVSGKIANKGEVDTIWIEATAGETLTFHCTPGTSAFDPSLLLAEPSGSWFEAGRLNRIAFNDEPLHFPGLSNDARLVHRFEKGGKFAIQVRAFSGQGGPDATYALRIMKGIGEPPLLHPPAGAGWEERRFTRQLPAAWLGKLAERGGRSMDASTVPVVKAAANEGAEPPVMTSTLR